MAGVWWAGLWSCQQAGWCDWGTGPAGSRQKAGGPWWWLWPWLWPPWLLWWLPGRMRETSLRAEGPSGPPESRALGGPAGGRVPGKWGGAGWAAALTEVQEAHVLLQRPPHPQGPAPGRLYLPEQGLGHVGCPKGRGCEGGTRSMGECHAHPPTSWEGPGRGLTRVKVHVHHGSDGAAGPQVPQADASEVLLHVGVPEEVVQLWVGSGGGLWGAAQAGLSGRPFQHLAGCVLGGKLERGRAAALHVPRSRCSARSPRRVPTWGQPSPVCRTAPAPRPPRVPVHPGRPWWLWGRWQ